MDSITRVIAEFAASLAFADLTDGAVHSAVQRLVDSFGCALGAHDCEPAQIGRKLAQGQSAGKYAGRLIQMLDLEPTAPTNPRPLR